MATKTSVILRSDKDWDSWIELIRTSAQEYDVWKHVDPYVNTTELPLLAEPDCPSPLSVRGQITEPTGPRDPKYSDLSTDEREHLRWLQTNYLEERKTYHRKVEAIAKLRTKIQDTIESRHFIYTRNQPSTYAVLVRT